jgi:hypothetical protein
MEKDTNGRKKYTQLSQGLSLEPRIRASYEFHDIKDKIDTWRKTGFGINTHYADSIIYAIIRLCEAVAEGEKVDVPKVESYPQSSPSGVQEEDGIADNLMNNINIGVGKRPTSKMPTSVPPMLGCVQSGSLSPKNPNPFLISYNYSPPVLTGVDEWSVFVRKYSDDQVVAVIQHKFPTQSVAAAFSVNNWNLGEYF